MTLGASIKMSDRQFDSLRRIVYDRSGIRFPDGKKYVLESRLVSRLVELEIDDFDQYIALLSMGPFQAEEFQELFDRITINETSFFRNEPQLDVFEKKILPELIERRKGARRLRIWSAACSSGEEPFTLAIIAARTLGVRAPDWNVEILGTDISERVLEIARSGEYGEYALRTTPQAVRQRYFVKRGDRSVVADSIKSLVHFEIHNLKDVAAARRFGTWDVIFCRNVMIYFDEQMRLQLLRGFADQLSHDGVLFIGHSESIKPGETPFTQIPMPQAFCYRNSRNAALLQPASSTRGST